MTRQRVSELTTPALLVDAEAFEHNLSAMAATLPGQRLRPHVKAHKCTAIAQRQRRAGHVGFTCATLREVERMAEAGLGEDLLLANEVVDARRLAPVLARGARVTLAVDSELTIEGAARAGVREVLIDVNVGLPRCGCAPVDAGALADRARACGLRVRGVMGYEGHAMAMTDAEKRMRAVEEAMEKLRDAHQRTGGEVISAGGTGTYALNRFATEIQAGSYVLMDTAYAKLELPFRQALYVWATVVSVSPGYAVADCGLKALGMDHGNPSIEGAQVWFCSDEHVTFKPEWPVRAGERIRVLPAHVDPTVAYHERIHLVAGEEVLETWPVDLRGW